MLYWDIRQVMSSRIFDIFSIYIYILDINHITYVIIHTNPNHLSHLRCLWFLLHRFLLQLRRHIIQPLAILNPKRPLRLPHTHHPFPILSPPIILLPFRLPALRLRILLRALLLSLLRIPKVLPLQPRILLHILPKSIHKARRC